MSSKFHISRLEVQESCGISVDDQYVIRMRSNAYSTVGLHTMLSAWATKTVQQIEMEITMNSSWTIYQE